MHVFFKQRREREREREKRGSVLVYLKCKETSCAAANLFIYRQERERR